jgi:tetratricopeptide (TPR) repeat protein
MSAEDQQIETLHQKASAQYLQGDFTSALDTWRQLLSVSPGDERAQEGVRLCEMLSQPEAGQSGSARPATAAPAHSATKASTPQPQPVQAAAAAGPTEGDDGLDFAMDELDLSLEIGGFDAPEARTDTPATPAGPPSAQPDPSRQAEGIDLGDLAEITPLSPAMDIPTGEPTRAAHAGGPAHADLAAAASSPAAPASESAAEQQTPDPSATAAAELARRTNELLAEAHATYARGEKEDALSILARVFILDEENANAVALQEQIQGEMETGAAEEPADDLLGDVPEAPQDPLDQALANLNLDTPAEAPEVPLHGGPIAQLPEEGAEVHEIPPEAVIPTPADGAPPAGPEAPLEIPLAGAEAEAPAEVSEADADVELEAIGDAPLETVEVELPSRRANRRLRIPIWAIGAVVVVALAAGAAYVFRPFGGSDSTDSSQPTTTAADAATTGSGGGADGQIPPEAATAADAGDSAGATSADALSPEQVRGLLADAGDAFERSDYSAAVLAYNRILKADPDHAEAHEGLQLAGERFRAQKELQEKWQEVSQNFDEGDYRSALTLLYRMPDTEDQERLARLKRNGWFNMGVQALTVSDCKTAKEHFKEATAVDPTDELVLLGLDLATTCREGKRDRAYQTAVQQLPYRTLED